MTQAEIMQKFIRMTMKVRITLIEESLGTAPGNLELVREFITKNAPNEEAVVEEIEALTVEEALEKSKTVFPRTNKTTCPDVPEGTAHCWDYQCKGMFKDACGMLWKLPVSESSKHKAYKKMIDGLIFPAPRVIPFHIPKGLTMGTCQRPLRAVTPTGPRNCLAISETVPIGTTFDIDINLLDERLRAVVDEWLDYGVLRGFSQWRNSGKGRFTWEYREQPVAPAKSMASHEKGRKEEKEAEKTAAGKGDKKR